MKTKTNKKLSFTFNPTLKNPTPPTPLQNQIGAIDRDFEREEGGQVVPNQFFDEFVF
jgi:hypothetical protein